MVAIGQTITVVNKSGKVVSNSKHLVNVFKEARSAYREKKAELKAEREEQAERHRRAEYRKKHRHDDGASVASSTRSSPTRASSRRHSEERHDGRRHGSGRHDGSRRGSEQHTGHRSKPNMERGYSDSFYDQSGLAPPERTKRSTKSPLQQSQSLRDHERQELARRRSDNDMMTIRRKPVASHEAPIDMDLAYGELPPPLPVRHGGEEQELRVKMTTLQKMLEEANCLQHSASTMIKNLEGNPEQMAAVALTLAEISNLASKMAPGALMSLKAAFPAVIALLISPEFLIAAGVGVGITVVALGGYKIIKRIQNKREKKAGEKTPEDQDEGNDLETIDGDLDRIELWRRGIEPTEAESLGTSVEGEYVTPAAAKQLRAEGRLDSKKEIKKRKDDKAAKDAAKKKDDSKKKAKAPKKSKPKDGDEDEDMATVLGEEEDVDKKKKKVKAEAKDEAKKKKKVKDEQDDAKVEKKIKAPGDEKNAFQKMFGSKKDKEVVGDFI